MARNSSTSARARASTENGKAQRTTSTSKTIPEQVRMVRNHKLSRRKLLIGLSALGVTAGAAATIAAATKRPATSHPTQSQGQHFQKHDQHITTQVRGDIAGHMADYAPHAIVEDPLFAAPFVGIGAITQRFAAEVAAVPNRTLRITNRVLHDDQLIVEWVAAGTHAQDFLGIGQPGRSYELTGVTVVIRGEDGKIVRESHYYDADALRRQIEG
jgi:steroid delta-isomerase-like uncharacterized protein